MCRALSIKLSRVSTFSAINLLYPLENRLASYLLAISQVNKDKTALYSKCNLREVAELLGTSYRHLLRTLSILKEKGAIDKEKEVYVIKDKLMLEKLSSDLYE